MEELIYSKYSNERDNKFRIRTDILINENNKKIVHKIPLNNEAREHINQIEKNYRMLSKIYDGFNVKINECTRIQNGLAFNFVDGVTIKEELDELVSEKNYDKFIEKICAYSEFVNEISLREEFIPTKEFIGIFGKVNLPNGIKSGKISNIDLAFANIINDGKDINIIDYEWVFSFPIPINFIIYRAISVYVNESGQRDDLLNLDIYNILNISDCEIKEYNKMESNFQKYVFGDTIPLFKFYNPSNNINIYDAIKSNKKERKKIQVFFDYGNGFSEKESIFIDSISEINCNYTFGIKVSHKVKNIRIDPCDYKSIVRVNDIHAYTTELYNIEYKVNGIKLNDNNILYSTNDPQIIICNLKENTTILNIELSIQKMIEECEEGLLEFINNKELKLENSKATIEKNKKKIIENQKNIEQLKKIIEEKQKNLEEKQKFLEEKQKCLDEKIRYISDIENSRGWKLLKFAKKIVGK